MMMWLTNFLKFKVGFVVLFVSATNSIFASELEHQVKGWLSAQHGVNESSIRVQQLDRRFHIPNCKTDWQFDQPFSQDTTVRARCLNPGRQLFLQALFPQSTPIYQKDIQEENLSSFVTTKDALAKGTVLKKEHLQVVFKTVAHSHPDVIRSKDDAIGMELVRNIGAGNSLRKQDMRSALMFKKGQEVMFTTTPDKGFKLTVKLEAAEDGRMGQKVRLLNRESGRNILALVTGPNTAQGL